MSKIECSNCEKNDVCPDILKDKKTKTGTCQFYQPN